LEGERQGTSYIEFKKVVWDDYEKYLLEKSMGKGKADPELIRFIEGIGNNFKIVIDRRIWIK